jgi:hypothetical protein
VTPQRALDGAVVAGVVLIGTGLVVDLVTIAAGDATADVVANLVLVPVVAAFTVLAPAIYRRRPGNPIGVMFAVLVCGGGIIVLTDAWAALVPTPDVGSRPHDDLAAWIANFAWVPFTTVLLCELPFRFPDGALLSPRWRRAERLAALQIAVLTLGLAFAPGRLNSYPIDNPYPGGEAFTVLRGIGFALLIACVGLGVVAIVLRFGRARDRERQQLKWLTYGAIVAALGFVAGAVFTFGPGTDVWAVTVPIMIAAVGLSAGAAVLRYRLYDIDRLISRTLSWIALTALLGAGYVVLVLAGQGVFSSFAGGSNLAIAVSTLVVAALFLPLRGRVQRVVDRRFYRRRYDAERTLEAFGARLREQVELEGVTADLGRVVAETVQPAHLSIWLNGARR